MPKMIEDYQYGTVVAERFALAFPDTTINGVAQAIHHVLDSLFYAVIPNKDELDTGLICYAADQKTVLDIQSVPLFRDWIRPCDNVRSYPRFHLIIQLVDLYLDHNDAGFTVGVDFYIHLDYMPHRTSKSEAGLHKVKLEATRIKSCVAQFLQPIFRLV